MWTVKAGFGKERGLFWRQDERGRQLGDKMSLEEIVEYAYARIPNDKYALLFLAFISELGEKTIIRQAKNRPLATNVAEVVAIYNKDFFINKGD